MSTISRADAIAQGFTIDDHCNPPFAYKGPRFQPDEFHYLVELPLTSDDPDETRTLISDREAHRIATQLSDDMDPFLDGGAVDVATVERFDADRASAGNLDDHERLMAYLRHHVGRDEVPGWAEWEDEAPPTFPTDGSMETAP